MLIRAINFILLFCALSFAQIVIAPSSYTAGGAPPAGGIELDATSTGTTGTISHTTGSGSNRLLIVCINLYDPSNPEITGITYNGDAFTVGVANPLSGTSIAALEIWYLVNPDVGTYDITISGTWSAGDGLAVVASSWTGVDQTTPVSDTGVDDGTNPSYAIVVDNGDIVVSCMGYYTGSVTLGANQTLLNTATGSGDGQDCVSDYETSTGGSVTMSYTHSASGSYTGACGVEVNVAP